jgi:hypothetical protein
VPDIEYFDVLSAASQEARHLAEAFDAKHRARIISIKGLSDLAVRTPRTKMGFPHDAVQVRLAISVTCAPGTR